MKKGWQEKTVGDILQLEYGKPLDESDRKPDGRYPVYGANGEKDRTDKFYHDKPSIIVGRKGSAGEINLTEKKFWPLDVTYFVTFDESQQDLRFLYYLLTTLELTKLAKGVKPGINRNEVYSQVTRVPPLTEQQRIVGLLDEAFKGISTAKANAEKNLQSARALFESYLQSVFTQRGPGWEEKRLDELCTFSSGGTPSKGNSNYWQGDIPWVSGRDMKSTRLSDSALHISQAAVDESATRMASAGTLLILVRGMGLAHGAQIAELLVPCAFNQDIRGIHAKPSMLPRYLLFALRDGINSSDTVLSNAAHGTLKIDSNELQKVMIPFPSLEQQRRIVAVIDDLSEEIQRLATIYERKLAALEALKKSLLHEAFTGELSAAA
jgi:type I restriction enzyme S subunit